MPHRQPTLLLSALLLALGLTCAACSEPDEDDLQDNNASSSNSSDNNANSSNNDPNNSSTNNAPNNASGNSSNNGSSNNDAPCSEPNACGGCEPLEGTPGATCGPCGEGTLACEGTNALICQHPGSLNVCGGCEPLEGTLGAPCGPCDDGTLACEGTNTLTCQNASSLNACGGCEVLEGTPGAPCGPCDDGTLACEGTDTLTCEGASNLNACGGCEPLEGTPDTPCGPCDDGTFVCEDTNTLTCQDASSLNICGGCAVLEGAPDQPCGPCADGTLACEGNDALTCQGATDDCREAAHCDDGIDNDGDDLADCDDEDCRGIGSCPDWSCVDVDLGSAVGRPVTDITAVGWGNDLDNTCLTDDEEVVFRWTAPHDGFFAFDSTGALSSGNQRLQVFQGDCNANRSFCSLGHNLKNQLGLQRTSAGLELRQGDSVLVVLEALTLQEVPIRLGITHGELPATSAGLIWRTSNTSDLWVVPDLSGDGLPDVIHGPGPVVSSIYSIFMDEFTPEPTRSHDQIYNVQTLAFFWDGTTIPTPFTTVFDTNQDGYQDVYLFSGIPQGGSTFLPGPPDWSQGLWAYGTVDPELWRPGVAWGDLTGDSLDDLVTWKRDPTNTSYHVPQYWEIYDNGQHAWEVDRAPLTVLEVRPFSAQHFRTAAVCDFDGDGAQDLLFTEDTPEGPVIRLLSGLVTTQTQAEDSTVLGLYPLPFNRFWTHDLFTVADLNSDGRCDLALGLPYQGRYPFDDAHGEVQIFFGPLQAPLSREHADLHMEDTPDRDLKGFGYKSVTGDFNGDGHTDLAVSAPGAQRDTDPASASTYGGLIFLFWGPFSAMGEIDPFTADRILTAYAPPDGCCSPTFFGAFMAAGDLDGDGFDEIVTFDGSEDDEFIVFPGVRLSSDHFGQEVQP